MKITTFCQVKIDAEVGDRFLFRDGMFSHIYEGEIKEVSPSGNLIKFQYSNGNTTWWESKDINIMEKLSQLGKLISQSLKPLSSKEMNRLWKKYEKDDPYQETEWGEVITKATIDKIRKELEL